MVVDLTASTAQKTSGGLQKYREGVDHRKEKKRGVAIESGVAKWCRAM